MSIAQNLKQARHNIGYKIYDAAKLAGITPGQLRLYESGRFKPMLSDLSKLAEVYKVTIEALMSAEPLPKEKFLHCKEKP